MKKVIRVTCPNCGLDQDIKVEASDSGYEVRRCYIEEGGCDLPFIVKTSWIAIATVFGMVESDSGMSMKEYDECLRGADNG